MSDFQTPTFHPQKYMVAAMTRQHNFFLFSFEFDIPITIYIFFPFFLSVIESSAMKTPNPETI